MLKFKKDDKLKQSTKTEKDDKLKQSTKTKKDDKLKQSTKTKKDDKSKQPTKTKKDDKLKQPTKTKKNDKLKISFKKISLKIKNNNLITSPDKIVFNKVIIDPTKLYTFRNYITKNTKQKPLKIEKDAIIFANINNNGVKLTTLDKYLESQKNIKGGFYDRNVRLWHVNAPVNQQNIMNEYINNAAQRFDANQNLNEGDVPEPILGTIENRINGRPNVYFEITAVPNDRLVISIYNDPEYNNECLHITCLYNTPSYVHFTIYLNCINAPGIIPLHIYYMANPTPNSFMIELIQFVDIILNDMFMNGNMLPDDYWTPRWRNLDENTLEEISTYFIAIREVFVFAQNHYRRNRRNRR